MTGHVPDVQPYYWNAAVFVEPLHLARGVQTKVLDAAAAGLPSVVTTTVRDGLPEEIARACTVADDPKTFAVVVVDRLGRGPDKRRALAARADLTALRWPHQLAALPAIFEEAARSRKDPAR